MAVADAALPVESAPVSSGAPPDTLPRRLPPKLLDEAAQRLAYLSVVMTVTVVIVEAFQRLTQPGLAAVYADPVNRLVTLAAVLLAAALFVLHRQRVILSSTALVLGMVFEVVVAFSISLIETSVPIDPVRPLLGISALGPWIVFVGAIIPNLPRWTLVTALSAAATWPIAYAINAARFGFGPVPLAALSVWPTINFLMAALAYLSGRRLYGAACQAHTAAELGSYRLVSPIGEGGMGEVWKASHRMLARTAAIKLVRRQSTASARQEELAVKRFKREANVIASLQSPHTVFLYDFGLSQDGRFYYVMELLDGISLQTLVATFGPQPAPRVLAILRQICRSLEEAHYLGLVHRDLKPSNVMLCKVALDVDVVKVLDFGLTKTISTHDVSQLTAEGMATGTPGYIAPEVALGDPKIDGRADVYALGCVAYFLLTGTTVFQDDNPMTLALRHVQADPDPPSTRTELPIPPDLEAIVMHCLAKKAEDRPSGAGDVAARLDACRIPAWTSDEAVEWWDRHLPPTSSLRSFAQGEVTPRVVAKV